MISINNIYPARFKILLISLFLISTLVSCEEIGIFRKPRWVGVITNDTPYAIKINAYTKSKLEYTLEIAAFKHTEVKLSERQLGLSEGIFYKGRDTAPIDLVDSVEIIFDNKKKILQYCGGEKLIGLSCESIKKNLVRIWDKNNQIVNKDGNLFFGYLYKFNITFTQEDYKLATEI